MLQGKKTKQTTTKKINNTTNKQKQKRLNQFKQKKKGFRLGHLKPYSRQIFCIKKSYSDLAVAADHRIKLKEYEKKDKYLDLARELKKLWNMQVTIIPIVIGAFGTVTKGILKRPEDLEIGGRVETIQSTALLRTARILRRVLETWGDLLSLKLQCKTIS